MASFLGLILFGFGLGVVAVVVLEAVGFLWIMERLRHKIVREEAELSTKAQLATASKQLDHQQSLHFAFQKQVRSSFSHFRLCQNAQTSI